MKNMTYGYLINNGRIMHSFDSGVLEQYYHQGILYLVTNNTIIYRCFDLCLYENGDYKFTDVEKRSTLMRGDTILYRTNPFHKIIHIHDEPNNTDYRVINARWITVEEVSFPFEESILDIIDAKIKEEHDRLSRSGEKR